MPKIIEVPNQGQVEFPDEMSDADIEAAIKKNALSYPKKTPGGQIIMRPKVEEGALKSSAVGQLLGLTDIGSNVIDAAVKLPGMAIPSLAQWNRTRNADREAIADERSDSLAFKGNRLAGNVISTLPVGGVLASGAKAAAPSLIRAGVSAPVMTALTNSLSSGGMRLGATGLSSTANAGIRALGGAATGAASAGAINPADAGMGAILGGALPGVTKLGGALGSKVAGGISDGAKRLMQSALKPTVAMQRSGEAKTAIDMLLKYGINPTKGGVEKLRGMIDGMNDEIADLIAASPATVSKQKVVGRLADVRSQFGNQVSPTSDLRAIQGTADDFLNHPNLVGDAIPVQAAQSMKQGTYRVLKKKFGQMGGAEVEAQKGLARGLKEEIAEAVPGVGTLNAEESKLLAALNASERRAFAAANNNPGGLALLASDPKSMGLFLLDKSDLFKSLMARSLNSTANGAQRSGAMLEGAAANPLLRNTTLQAGSGRE